MRLGIFGGTFDPIHDAHLKIASAAADALELDRVLLVPAAHPPHKADVAYAPYEHRLRMAELACGADDRISVSRIEEGAGRSYSIDTIEKLRAQMNSGDELFFIIGADAFAEIRTWRRWTDVAREVRFIVVNRPGASYESPPGVQFTPLTNLNLHISSSQIRAELAAGRHPVGVPDSVLRYIFDHGLYAA